MQRESTTASSTPTSSVASISSVAGIMADFALVEHGRLSRGRDGEASVKWQALHIDGDAPSLNQNHVATEFFNMSVDDWQEVEEEFFPEDCPVIRCS